MHVRMRTRSDALQAFARFRKWVLSCTACTNNGTNFLLDFTNFVPLKTGAPVVIDGAVGGLVMPCVRAHPLIPRTSCALLMQASNEKHVPYRNSKLAHLLQRRCRAAPRRLSPIAFAVRFSQSTRACSTAPRR